MGKKKKIHELCRVNMIYDAIRQCCRVNRDDPSPADAHGNHLFTRLLFGEPERSTLRPPAPPANRLCAPPAARLPRPFRPDRKNRKIKKRTIIRPFGGARERFRENGARFLYTHLGSVAGQRYRDYNRSGSRSHPAQFPLSRECIRL